MLLLVFTCLVFSDLCSLNIDYVKGKNFQTFQIRCFGRDFFSERGGFFAEGGAQLYYVTTEVKVPTKPQGKKHPKRAYSSAGQSAPLIRVRSQVQVLVGPPFFGNLHLKKKLTCYSKLRFFFKHNFLKKSLKLKTLI